jgi:hypothetical protein
MVPMLRCASPAMIGCKGGLRDAKAPPDRRWPRPPVLRFPNRAFDETALSVRMRCVEGELDGDPGEGGARRLAAAGMAGDSAKNLPKSGEPMLVGAGEWNVERRPAGAGESTSMLEEASRL